MNAHMPDPPMRNVYGMYRKRPVVVEAAQHKGVPSAELEEWLGEAFESWLPSTGQLVFRIAKSNNKEVTIDDGDWIIKEADGSGFYPCEMDVFVETYEEV